MKTQQSLHPIDRFLAALRRGERPTDGQFQAALLSSLVCRRLHTARNIDSAYGPSYELAGGLLRWASGNGRLDIVALLYQGFPELAAAPQNDTEYHPDLPRPESDLWGKLLASLQTEDPYFDAPNHVGAFEHHKRRVSIFCDPQTLIGDLESQRNIITRDLHRLWSEHPDLHNHLKREVSLPDGSCQTVTSSGLLALLKCAGPRGAANWLTTPKEREQFPTTTSTFVACNGIF